MMRTLAAAFAVLSLVTALASCDRRQEVAILEADKPKDGIPLVSGDPTVVTVAFDNSYPPYAFGSENQSGGLYVDIVSAAMTEAGIPCKPIALPWKRALAMAQEGTCAIAGIYRTEPRLLLFDYSDPIFEERMLIFVTREKTFPFANLTDLAGKRVGVNRGWSYGDEFDTARAAGIFSTDEAQDNQANFKKLLSGRIDCFAADEVSAAIFLKMENLSGSIVPLPVPFTSVRAYLAFGKDDPRGKTLAAFNIALARLKTNGTYGHIVAKYFLEESGK